MALTSIWDSLVAQMVKNLSAMQETCVQFLGWADPWRRKWQPIQVFLPGKFQQQGSPAGYSPWDRKESDTTEKLTFSQLYVTTEKTIALTARTFVNKVLSLLFNILSKFVITFLPRSKRLLISWLQSSSAVIFEPKKTTRHCFHCFPLYLPWSDGTGFHDLHFLNAEF